MAIANNQAGGTSLTDCPREIFDHICDSLDTESIKQLARVSKTAYARAIDNLYRRHKDVRLDILCWSACRGFLRPIKILVERGYVDVNAVCTNFVICETSYIRPHEGNIWARTGKEPYATGPGVNPLPKVLSPKKDVQAMVPLQAAFLGGDEETIDYLISKGARLHKSQRTLSSSIFYARSRFTLDCILEHIDNESRGQLRVKPLMCKVLYNMYAFIIRFHCLGYSHEAQCIPGVDKGEMIGMQEHLLAMGGDANACSRTDMVRYPPDMCANPFWRSQREAASDSLSPGTETNVHHITPLILATQMEELDIMELFLARGALPDMTVSMSGQTSALVEAVSGADIETIKCLLDWNADVNGSSLTDINTPLIQAIHGGDDYVDVVQFLLQRGADPNKKLSSDVHGSMSGSIEGSTALIEAARLGDDQIIEVLLEHGANPNQYGQFVLKLEFEGEYVYDPFFIGVCPLRVAVMCQFPSTYTLLKAGANPNPVYDGGNSYSTSPHIKAAIFYHDNPTIVQALIEHGAKVPLDALDMAADLKRPQIMRLLLRLGGHKPADLFSVFRLAVLPEGTYKMLDRGDDTKSLQHIVPYGTLSHTSIFDLDYTMNPNSPEKHCETMGALLEYGVDINQPPPPNDKHSTMGTLLEFGVDIDPPLPPNGKHSTHHLSAIMASERCIPFSQVEYVIDYLFANGADPNVWTRTEKGTIWTPLHAAMRHPLSPTEYIHRLLSAGANPLPDGWDHSEPENSPLGVMVMWARDGHQRGFPDVKKIWAYHWKMLKRLYAISGSKITAEFDDEFMKTLFWLIMFDGPEGKHGCLERVVGFAWMTNHEGRWGPDGISGLLDIVNLDHMQEQLQESGMEAMRLWRPGWCGNPTPRQRRRFAREVRILQNGLREQGVSCIQTKLFNNIHRPRWLGGLKPPMTAWSLDDEPETCGLDTIFPDED